MCVVFNHMFANLHIHANLSRIVSIAISLVCLIFSVYIFYE